MPWARSVPSFFVLKASRYHQLVATPRTLDILPACRVSCQCLSVWPSQWWHSSVVSLQIRHRQSLKHPFPVINYVSRYERVTWCLSSQSSIKGLTAAITAYPGLGCPSLSFHSSRWPDGVEISRFRFLESQDSFPTLTLPRMRGLQVQWWNTSRETCRLKRDRAVTPYDSDGQHPLWSS